MPEETVSIRKEIMAIVSVLRDGKVDPDEVPELIEAVINLLTLPALTRWFAEAIVAIRARRAAHVAP